MKNGNLGTGGGNSGMPFVPWLSTLFVYCPDTGLAFVGMANSTLPTMATHDYGGSEGWMTSSSRFITPRGSQGPEHRGAVR